MRVSVVGLGYEKYRFGTAESKKVIKKDKGLSERQKPVRKHYKPGKISTGRQNKGRKCNPLNETEMQESTGTNTGGETGWEHPLLSTRSSRRNGYLFSQEALVSVKASWCGAK